MSKASDLARLMTSGSTAIHGEAGVTASGSTGLTTNLQQGLAKCWINYTGSDASSNDSFNVSGTTDDATGKTTVTISSDMSNANYTVALGTSRNGSTTADNQTEGFFGATTGLVKVNTMRADNQAYTDFTNVTLQICGDLA
jgi:hypothetical protein